MTPAVEAQGPNHWTPGEILVYFFFLNWHFQGQPTLSYGRRSGRNAGFLQTLDSQYHLISQDYASRRRIPNY